MSEWTVTVTWDATDPVTVDQLERVAALAGAVAGEPGRIQVECTMTVEADSIATAVGTVVPRLLLEIPGEVAWVEILTTAEADRRLAEPAFPELVGITEIADMLDVTRQWASALQTNGDFPAPVAILASGPVWRRADLSTFELLWKRKGGRPTPWVKTVSKRRADIAAIRAKRLPDHPSLAIVGVEVTAGKPIEDLVRPYDEAHAIALSIGMIDPPKQLPNGAVVWERPPPIMAVDTGLDDIVAARALAGGGHDGE